MPTPRANSPDLDASLGLQLQRGCDALELDVPVEKRALLLAYLALLDKWNKTYNLTGVRDSAQMVTRHLLDSLSIAPWVRGRRGIDVGTGAGLPGIPLAILFPEREFHLLDSNGKKTRFLFQVKTALGLDNMVVHQTRVETFQTADPFDMVFSRAFASLVEMLRACRHLPGEQGCLLAMKGAHPAAEVAALDGEGAQAVIHPLSVPGLDEQRHLVEITLHRNGTTP